jgi:hypothetical protein
MKVNKWTLGLAACGLVSLPTLVQSEEKLSALQTALSSTTISGYVNTSAQWDIGTGNANVPGFAYNNSKQDGFSLNVVKVTIERPLDEGQWSAGYKVDTVYGPDANQLATQSTGIPADFGIKQAYVALRAPVGNGLDIKLGVFDTIVGYETFDAGSNPNFTRSYGYTIEPTTHTGLLLTYQLNDMLGFSAGIANTFGPMINQQAWANGRAESYKTYMASVAFSAPKEWGFVGGSTLYAGIINGLNTGFAGTGTSGIGARDTHFYIGGAITTPMKGLKLGASYDYAAIDDTSTNPDGDAWAAALYASFSPEGSKFGVHLRGEYASHSPGLYGANNVTFVSATANQVGVFPSKVFALTGTVQYDLWKNVLSRVEARWDHAANGADSFAGSTPGSPELKNHFMLVANLIYKF